MPSAKHNLEMDKADLFTAWYCFVLRFAFLPTTVHTIHTSWTYLCLPLCSSSFCWQHRCQFIIPWHGFSQTVPPVLSAFKHYSSSVSLCNGWCIWWSVVTISLSARDWLLGYAFRDNIISGYLIPTWSWLTLLCGWNLSTSIATDKYIMFYALYSNLKFLGLFESVCVFWLDMLQLFYSVPFQWERTVAQPLLQWSITVMKW